MMVAGYSVASFVATWGLSLWLGVAVGLLAAVVLALLLGVPTLRLRADYLAIVTIAAAEAIRQILASVALTKYFNGYNGLSGFSDDFYALNPFHSSKSIGIPGTSLEVTWGPQDFFSMVVGWALVALCCLFVFLLMRSPWGRVLKAIREDEDAVRSLGKNVFSYKMQSLVIGGVFGALAGMLVTLNLSSTSPAIFATDITFFAYTVLLLGGAARVFGPVVGAIIFQLSISFLDLFFDQATLGSNPLIPSSIMANDQASLVRFIAMGLVLMLLMIYRPQGIFGDRRELAIDAR
jgi:branched-chain amino acid transport system permease protein